MRTSCAAVAARTQVAIRAPTDGSLTCPATVLRATPRRVCTKPNSRSPCAAWLRFMKSMSMDSHGMSRCHWVCRCRNGFCSASRPWIHIFAGEKVCIHPTSPTHASSAFASSTTRRIASAVVSTGFQTTGTGIRSSPSTMAATSRDCVATCASVSSP